jgi:polar amino acid transport system substrate-binding protein
MRTFAVAIVALAATPALAVAQDCARTYTVASGDTLSRIAVREFDDYRKWSAIYNANIEVIGRNPNIIRVGLALRLPCLEPVGGEPLVTEAAAPTEQEVPVASDGSAPAPAPADAADAAEAASAESGTATPAADAEPVAVAAVAAAATDADADAGAVRLASLAPDAAVAALPVPRKINLLTADDYAPFTDRKLIEGGLITDIVAHALSEDDHEIVWVNDWAAHLEPLLSKNFLDMGFPWLQPDCVGDAENFRCVNFHFSEPMFEMLVLLFTAKDRPLEFNSDDDILGKTLCRPTGYYTHDLEKDGRRWLSDNKITFKQPRAVEDCFRMLLAGEVDAAAFNEFTGRSAIKDMGIEDQIVIVESRPLSIEGLHVVVHKDHPDAEALLAEVNEGLERIRRSGDYQSIVDKHLAAFWEKF